MKSILFVAGNLIGSFVVGLIFLTLTTTVSLAASYSLMDAPPQLFIAFISCVLLGGYAKLISLLAMKFVPKTLSKEIFVIGNIIIPFIISTLLYALL